MFTVEQIEKAHEKVKSGTDFPNYIQEIKQLGVIAFETWVYDSHTEYFGINNFHIELLPQYDALAIADSSNADEFSKRLKSHQRGETDYFTYCRDCAANGIERWYVCLTKMTCTYFDKDDNELVTEEIPL